MEIFQYGQTELAHLKKQDQTLAQVIDQIGMIESAVIPDLFTALVNSIVSQQISSKAAATVWNRVLERFETLTPQIIAVTPVEEIQRCGMSMRKASYIQKIASAVVRDEVNFSALPGLSDEEIVRSLSSLPGIGVWTAEMIMIFSMQRPNILSWGDLGIRRGIMKLYGHEKLEKSQFEQYKARYSPYGSVASLYLWEISQGEGQLF